MSTNLHNLTKGDSLDHIYSGAHIVFIGGLENMWVDYRTDITASDLMEYAQLDCAEMHRVVAHGDDYVVIILSGGYVKISSTDNGFKFKPTLRLGGVWI